MASFRKDPKTKKWQFWYYDVRHGQPWRRKKTGYTDKGKTKDLASDLEEAVKDRKNGLLDPKAEAYRDHESTPITEHVAAFRRSIQAKGGSKRHPEVTESRVLKVLELAKVKRISEMTLSKVLDGIKRIRDEGLGGETPNHYIRAVKGFSRFLQKDGRSRDHLLAHLSTTKSQPKKNRRKLTPDECVKLIQAARMGRKHHKLSGEDRAILYEIALGTGFRANELRSLTVVDFHLDSEHPTIRVLAKNTKNRKEVFQPINRELVVRIRSWLANKTPGSKVFGEKLTERTAEMLRVDLKAAGIPHETASGVVDFHGTRVTYISDLVSSGVSVKTAMDLARHSTADLTLGVYAKASLHDLDGAVENLPSRSPSPPQREAMAATGTDHGCGSSATRSATLPYRIVTQDEQPFADRAIHTRDLKSFGG